MLTLLSPKKIQGTYYRNRLDEAGIRGGWNYALDHAWLFEKIDHYIKNSPAHFPIIIDVGCGNSMLHTFLEEELHLGIIGIDRVFGQCPYDVRDRRMDLCIDFAKQNTFFSNNVDVIYWCSSIEHNSIEEMKTCVDASLKALKPGGLFLATFSYSKTTYYFEDSDATNLSKWDAEDVFGEKWEGTTDYDVIAAEYAENIFNLSDRYKKRYGRDGFDFLVAGVEIIKQPEDK